LTSENIRRRLAIVFKGTVLTAPTIMTRMSSSAIIAPGANALTDRQIQDIVEAINAQARPNAAKNVGQNQPRASKPDQQTPATQPASSVGAATHPSEP
jgi:preprotein translocase subunit SecD